MPRGVYKRKKKVPLSGTTAIAVEPYPMPGKDLKHIKSIDFDVLAGLKASLYYNNNMNQFQLGGVLFEVMENEEDDYRSSMQEVQILDENAERKPGEYLAGVTIKIVADGIMRGYELVDDVDGHVWLLFGTSNYDDYYPCFTFVFTPKPSAEDSIKSKIL